MCRGLNDPCGGRRCPGESTKARRARQRAAKAAARARAAPPTPAAANTLLPVAIDTDAELADAVTAARNAVQQRGALLVTPRRAAWPVATPHGARVDLDVRTAGAAVLAAAQEIERATVLDAAAATRWIDRDRTSATSSLGSSEEAAQVLEARRALPALVFGQEAVTSRAEYEAAVHRALDKVRWTGGDAVAEAQRRWLRDEGEALREPPGCGLTTPLWDRESTRLRVDSYQAILGTGDGHFETDSAFLAKVTTYFPQEWLDAAAPVNVRVRPTGGGYRDASPRGVRAEVIVGSRLPGYLEAGLGSALHEFAHHVEVAVPEIAQIARTHQVLRTITPEGTRHPLVPIVGADPGSSSPPRSLRALDRGYAGDWSRPDSFLTDYVGKETSSSHSEVFTTGVEAVFGGAMGAFSA